MGTNSTIRVSVIVPTKNRTELLQDTLNALAAQTLPPEEFELFIMDDQSTDSTEETSRQFAETAPFRVHYYKMDREGGPVPARNRAAKMAKGSILAFTDSDCRPCPEWLQRGVAEFTEGVGLVTGPITYKPEQEGGFFSKRTAETLVEHPTYPTANAFYLKKAFLDLGGFDTDLCYPDPLDRAVECADADLAWRVIKSGYKNKFVDSLWVYHEIEAQTRTAWLLEPTRLFVLPALINRHSELRDQLLFKRLFFYRGSVLYYLALVIGVPLLMIDWRWIFAPLILILLRAFRRLKPVTIPQYGRAIGQVCMNVVRNYLLILTLVYGSLRFRTLVL